MSETNWEKFDQLTDEDIDLTDNPPLTEEQMSAMRPLGEMFPELIQTTAVSLEQDIANWAKHRAAQSDQSVEQIVNSALRAYISHRNEPLEEIVRRVIREELRAA